MLKNIHLVIGICLLLSACVRGPDIIDFLETHPEFETMNYHSEAIQLTSYISFRPLIHLRISATESGGTFEYAKSNEYLRPLRQTSLSPQQYTQTRTLFRETAFWQGYGECAELSHANPGIDYEMQDGKCQRVFILDGAYITVEASKDGKILGTKQWSGAIGYKNLRKFIERSFVIAGVRLVL